MIHRRASSLLLILLLVTSAPFFTLAQRAVVEKVTVATNVKGIRDIQVGNFGGKANDTVLTGGTNGVLLMKKSGNAFAAPQTVINSFSNGESIDIVAVGDLNGDGADDFVHVINSEGITDTAVTTATSAIQSAIARQSGGNSFDIQGLLPSIGLTLPKTGVVLARVNGRDVKLADIDGDDKLDIIATVNGNGDRARTGALVYLRNTGGNVYETTYIDESLGGIALLSIADFDVDGRPDIATVRIDTKELVVYFNEADGNFTKSIIDAQAESNMCIATGDFNNIGRPDIMLMGLNTIHIYINMNDRRFSKFLMFDINSTDFKSKDYRDMQCAFSDMDGNGLLDMVVAQGYHDGVEYYSQTTPNVFSGPARRFATANSTSDFIIRDMNGNGYEDVVAVSVAEQAVYAFMVGQQQPAAPTMQPVPNPTPQQRPTMAPARPPTKAPAQPLPAGGGQCSARGAQCSTSMPCCSTDDVCRGVCARKTTNNKAGDKNNIKLDFAGSDIRGMRGGRRQRILKGSSPQLGL